jgi:hypothetical protein
MAERRESTGNRLQRLRHLTDGPPVSPTATVVGSTDAHFRVVYGRRRRGDDLPSVGEIGTADLGRLFRGL